MSNINPLWTACNKINNEGGEGYNPHDQYIETSDGPPEWIKLDGEQYRLRCRMNGTSMSDPRYAAMKKEYDELEMAVEIARELDI